MRLPLSIDDDALWDNSLLSLTVFVATCPTLNSCESFAFMWDLALDSSSDASAFSARVGDTNDDDDDDDDDDANKAADECFDTTDDDDDDDDDELKASLR